MSTIRRYAAAAALIGVMSLAACGTTRAGPPGLATSPNPATSTPSPATTTPLPSTMPPADSATPKVSQRLGSHGSAVKTLQQRLIALHYVDVSTADTASLAPHSRARSNSCGACLLYTSPSPRD